MLTYTQVRDACPEQWSASGEEWLVTAGSVADAGGAAQHLDQVDAATLACRASAALCKSLSDALRIAQHCLLHAVELAVAAGLTVDETGAVHLPPGAAGPRMRATRHTAQFLIGAAVRGAGEAEQIATALLQRLAAALVGMRDRAVDLSDATRAGQEMLAGLVPTGTPEEVAAWWGALSEEDRHTLILAVPARLAGALTGVWPRDARRPGPVPEDDSHGQGIWTGWHWLDEEDQVRVPQWAQARASCDFWHHQGCADRP
jgi:hypothetical protein